MDIGLNHGAVDTNLTAFFNTYVFGETDKTTIDGFPGFRRNRFDIFAKHGFFESFIGYTDKTKPFQTYRINQMKGQILKDQNKDNVVAFEKKE